MQKLIFSLVVVSAVIIPVTVFAKVQQTETIDDAMPSTIPSEIVADWKKQDGSNFSTAIDEIKKSIDPEYAEKITGTGEAGYLSACHWRRVSRMQPYTEQLRKVLFSRHHNLGGMIIGYLEDLNSDRFSSGIGDFGNFSIPSKSDNYKSGAALCIIDMKNYYAKSEDLLADARGVVRDPCVSFDGKKIVFAWSKDNNGYHLYEIDVDDPDNARQLTDDPNGLTVSDYEPCYLQNGDIIFNSSRCFGHVDCNFNVTSNLFIINHEGKYLRRIGYDQVQTFSPSMLSEGKVMYSRWEYNDRNIVNSCGLFSMNPDGTAQMEHFGNQTEWPSTIIQARQIPNSNKILAIFGAHEAPYSGDIGIIDPDVARNGLEAIQLIAPLRDDPGRVNVQSFDGGVDYLFQNPHPLDEEWFLISWRESTGNNYNGKFSIYLMNTKGERELLAWDANQSVSQPMSLAPRDLPPTPRYQADYTQETAQVMVQDVYYGTGTGSKVPKGSIKKMRVIALEYRTDPSFGNAGSMGYTMTPVARWTGSWEAKRIIGETPVEEDGSAAFIAPAREPLYLQLIDEKGRMVQTMRSWMTLQPGEKIACVGCHEDKNESPPEGGVPIASQPKALNPFFDISNDYLYYPDQIQPIFDKNCNKSGCHDQSHASLDLRGDKLWTGDLGSADEEDCNRYWCRSYWNLVKKQRTYVDWITIMSSGKGLPPYPSGSSTSKLISHLLAGHKNLDLSEEEIGKLCAWIDLAIPHSGSYGDDMKPEIREKWETRMDRRRKHQELEEKNIAEFIDDGGYDTYTSVLEDNSYSPVAGAIVKTGTFSVRFSMIDRQLSLRLPSAGRIQLVDLQGRQLMKMTVSKKNFMKSAERMLPVKLPAGVYIVKFNGNELHGEQVVSIL